MALISIFRRPMTKDLQPYAGQRVRACAVGLKAEAPSGNVVELQEEILCDLEVGLMDGSTG